MAQGERGWNGFVANYIDEHESGKQRNLTCRRMREIWVFGNPDKSELGFLDRTDLVKYISKGVFHAEHRRYRYTSSKNADIIVISRDGLAFGRFDIIEKVKPTKDDKEAYPRVQYVYRVRNSSIYEKPVLLSNLSIKLGQFGKRIDEDQFAELQKLAGKVSA